MRVIHSNKQMFKYGIVCFIIIVGCIVFAPKKKDNIDELLLTIANASYIVGCIQTPFKTWLTRRPDDLSIFQQAEICQGLLEDAGLETLINQIKERYEQRANKN